jgi:hypothetical protein
MYRRSKKVAVHPEVSMENVREDPNLSDKFVVRRKAARRTHPFDLAAEELLLEPLSSLLSQAEYNPAAARKRPRLEEPLPTTTEEAARKTASPDVTGHQKKMQS